jgi:hypothetical protein
MTSQIQLSELRLQWHPPDGLNRSRPRPVRLTGPGKALLVIAIILGIAAPAAGIALGLVARRQVENARLLREESAVTEGRVTRLWRGRDDEKQPWMAYRFSGQGQTYERNAKVSLRRWQGLRVGSPLPVYYVPSRPDLSNPFTTARTAMPPWVPFLVAIILAGGSFLATLPIRSQHRLLSEGRPAPGLVMKHGQARRSSHGRGLESKYYYEFPLLSGAIAKGEAGPCKNPPVIGSTIPVIYDPDNPRRNAPYPFSLVSPADLRMR